MMYGFQYLFDPRPSVRAVASTENQCLTKIVGQIHTVPESHHSGFVIGSCRSILMGMGGHASFQPQLLAFRAQ